MQVKALRLQSFIDAQLNQLALASTALIVVPVLMAWAWIQFFAIAFNQPIIALQQVLALSGIATVYSLDRLIDPDPRLLNLYKQGLKTILISVCVVSVLISLLTLWTLHWAPWQIVLCCCALSVANWLGKKVFMGKNIFVTAAWLCSCALLPFAPFAWAVHDYLLIIPWFVLFMLACVLCDVKDIEHDRSCSVKSLPVLVGAQRSLRVVLGALLFAFGFSVFFGAWHLSLMALLLLICASMHKIMAHPLLAPLVVDSCLVLSAFYVFVA